VQKEHLFLNENGEISLYVVISSRSPLTLQSIQHIWKDKELPWEKQEGWGKEKIGFLLLQTLKCMRDIHKKGVPLVDLREETIQIHDYKVKF
jgi:hypothetical protein